jgi:hypothetical protein
VMPLLFKFSLIDGVSTLIPTEIDINLDSKALT